MSIGAVDQTVQRWASMSNSFSVDLLHLHRPEAGSFGYLVCAERCSMGDNAAGDYQLWPCASARMAILQIGKTHTALEREAKFFGPVNAD